MRYLYNRIEFFLNGTAKTALIPPGLTTLDFLQRELGLFGTKCSCNEGDCGACTVAVAEIRDGRIIYEALNSCIYPAARLHGKHLITIEALGTPEQLHPIQEAMLQFHATQCGYCSPGFVMSAFALFAERAHPSKEELLAGLEGNLCRCTGYDSILRAMLELASKDYEIVLPALRAVEAGLGELKPMEYVPQESSSIYACEAYFLPQSLEEALRLMREHPEHQLLCGATDIMVQINIAKRKFKCLIDLSFLRKLRYIKEDGEGILIGSLSTYSDLLESGVITQSFPAFRDLINIIASRQIRNSGTIAGNIGNASPVGDSLPLLLCLDARLRLVSEQGSRELALKDYFVSYKHTALQEGELIEEIILAPVDYKQVFIRIKKAAKRKSVDISAISSAICLHFDADGKITQARLAYGGAAAIPRLASGFEALVLGKKPEELEPEALAEAVAEEFTPLSDVRGSASYRKQLISNQLLAYLLEAQGRSL